MLKPRRDTVYAQCVGGPRDGERWAAYMYGSPMFADARLKGYRHEPERGMLVWEPDNAIAAQWGGTTRMIGTR